MRESGGSGTACREDEIQEGMTLLAETEGILSEPAGGVVIAGLRTLVAEISAMMAARHATRLADTS